MISRKEQRYFPTKVVSMKAVPGGKVSNTPKKSAAPAASVAQGATGKKIADVAPTSAKEIEPEVYSHSFERRLRVS